MFRLCLPYPKRNKARLRIIILGTHPKLKNTALQTAPPQSSTYRAVENHQALVEMVVLQGGMAVELGKRVLTSENVLWKKERKERKRSVSTICQFIDFFFWLTKKGYFTSFIKPTLFSPFAEKRVR